LVTQYSIDKLLVIQARTTSRRLPKKVLREINGRPVLEWQVERAKQTKGIDRIIIATSQDKSDDEVEKISNKCGVPIVRGSLGNVLSRFMLALDIYNPRSVVRITGDCPLYMPKICEDMLEDFDKNSTDYLSNVLVPTFPDGCDIEIFTALALKRVSKLALSQSELEHVTLGIYKRKEVFNCRNFRNSFDDSSHRWTLDTEEDLTFVRQVYGEFMGRELTFGYHDVMEFLFSNPKIARIDDGSMRNSELKNV
jgi:spore coat polysaccharide biosynthesis protein SpsF (cytidylyltransferase family)